MVNKINTIRIFLEDVNGEFHLREIARMMKKSPATVKKYLAESVKEGIVLKKKERGFEIYKANTESNKYKELKKIYNKNKIIESGLLKFLVQKFNIPVIIVFGSYARGEDNKNSDIDFFILSEIKTNVTLDKYEKLLKRRIQVHNFNKKQFNELKKKNPELINSIINGIVLNGFLEVL